MNNLIDRIDNELKGEQLLFLGTTQYTEEEKLLMKNAVSKRIDKSISYQYLAYGYFSKLVGIYGVDNFDLNNYVDSCILNIVKREEKKVSNEEMDEIVDWAMFAIGETYGYTAGDYISMIRDAIIPIKKMEQLYGNQNIFEYANNTNFLVTNSFLLTRYPDFFDKEKIDTLNLVISAYDRSAFSTKEDLHRFKKARRVLISNIVKYENKNSKNKSKRYVDIIRYKM